MTADNGWMQPGSRDKDCGAAFDAPFPVGTGYYRPADVPVHQGVALAVAGEAGWSPGSI